MSAHLTMISTTKSSIGNSIPDMQLKSTHQSHRGVNNQPNFAAIKKPREKKIDKYFHN